MTVKDSHIIKALEQTKGQIHLAARRLGISPQTIYNHAEKSQKIRECIDNQRGEMIDTAELALYNAVLKGEPWAVQYTLKTIGKDRGYVEKTEIDSKVENSGNIIVYLPGNGRDQ